MNPSKSSVLSSTLLALLASPLVTTTGYGFAEVARGAVTLETTARLSYDSYFIGADNPGDDDYYATLSPTLRYSRKAGLAETAAWFGVQILRHDKNSTYDSENFSAGASTSLPVVEGSRLSGDFNISYAETMSVDYTVMDRVPSKNARVAGVLNYKLGLKTSISDSIGYNWSDRSGYSDQETFTNDLSFRYSDFLRGTSLRISHSYNNTTSSGENILGADLDQESHSISTGLSRPIYGELRGELSYGYRFLKRSANESIIGQTENNGSFFGATLTGPFLPRSKFPKLESSASLNYSESVSPGINDVGQKTLTGHVRLSWEARERTRLSFDTSRSVDLSATDLSVETTRVSLGLTQSVGYAGSLSANASYHWREFRGVERNDETLDITVGYNYQLTRYWSAGANYTYEDNSTDGEELATAPMAGFRMRPTDYERHLVSVYVTNIF